ncbi:MAG TPA: response regulator [Hyphomicrobiaceae bacterium]|nr:response regulator [Hyphomicrobiaceae bacterium]
MSTHDEPSESRLRALVLCVDDDIGRALAHWLRDSGAEVDVPEDGKRAARMLRKERYNAIVTDRFLPPWPGLDTLPLLKRKHPNLRLIVVLNSAPAGMAAVLRLAGIDAVIEPPLRRAEVCSAVTPS